MFASIGPRLTPRPLPAFAYPARGSNASPPCFFAKSHLRASPISAVRTSRRFRAAFPATLFSAAEASVPASPDGSAVQRFYSYPSNLVLHVRRARFFSLDEASNLARALDDASRVLLRRAVSERLATSSVQPSPSDVPRRRRSPSIRASRGLALGATALSSFLARSSAASVSSGQLTARTSPRALLAFLSGGGAPSSAPRPRVALTLALRLARPRPRLLVLPRPLPSPVPSSRPSPASTKVISASAPLKASRVALGPRRAWHSPRGLISTAR